MAWINNDEKYQQQIVSQFLLDLKRIESEAVFVHSDTHYLNDLLAIGRFFM